MRLPHITTGNTGNPPVLFLHGFLGSGGDWEEVAKQLSGRYLCIMPDLPGHGSNANLSSAPTLNYETVSAQLLELLDELDLDKSRIVGYSMGGRIALYFAIHHPERVLQLVLESASPGIEGEEEREARREQDRASAGLLRAKGIDAFVERWYAMDLFASMRKNPGRFEQMKQARKQTDPAAMAAVIEAFSPGAQPPLWDQLGSLQVPVFLVAGEEDEKYVAISERMEQLLPDSARMVFPQAGHNAHLEDPKAYAEMLSACLK
jgi:2-succinyl-6-hydroxy-2,4-cyclohexadiene-1-carboxylate synthase